MTVESETSPQPSVVLDDLTAMDSFDSSAMTPQDMRMLLGRLGYTPPAEMTPQDMEAATALFKEMPQDLMAAALNPGMEVSFTADAAGMASLDAELSMSEVQTGPGFEQTQSFSLSIERQQPDLALLEPSLASKYALLPEPMRERVAGWGISFEDGVQVRVGVASVGISGASGDKLTYQAVVPPDIGQKIAAGDLSVAPDPTNPMAMPVGSSVVIRGEAFESTTYQGSLGQFRGSETITELEGHGFGIKRIDEHVFEVTQGPIDAVESDFFLGVGSNEISVGVVKDRQFEDETLSIARMDLTTPEGQQAYREFMQSGTVPDQTGPGIVRAGESRRLSLDEQSGLEINLGPVSAEFVAGTTYESSLTQWDDGIAEDRVSGNALGAGFDVSSTISPGGSVDASSRRWTVTYDDLSAESAQMVQMAFSTDGNGQQMPETVHTEMRFTDSELMQIRDRARDHVSQFNPALSAAIDAGATDVTTHGYIEFLATAQTPEEVFKYGFMNPLDNSEVAQSLATLRMQGNDDVVPPPLAGELELRDESMGLLFEQTGPALPPPAVSAEAPVMPLPPTSDWPPIVPTAESGVPIEGTQPPAFVPPGPAELPPIVPPEPSAVPPVVDTK
jgi:hypothetical protein